LVTLFFNIQRVVMDTSQTKSTAIGAAGTGNSVLSGQSKISAEKLAMIAALARLEGELEAFIESADTYLCKLSDNEYYNLPGNLELGDIFATATAFKRDSAQVRRKLE
jgi:hypothetical protein